MFGDNETAADVPDLSFSESITQITSGYSHNCAVNASFKVVCWGKNDYGQLGLGHTQIMGDDETVKSIPLLNLE